MITRDSIIINDKIEKVYAVARDIEKQHEYIHGYSPAKIIEKKEDGKIVIERVAELHGKVMKWKSIAEFEENKAIRFEQIEGKLKGMKIEWLFQSINEGTRVEIIHDFSLKIPALGWFAERYIARPKIDGLTRNVLVGMKNKIEGGK